MLCMCACTFIMQINIWREKKICITCCEQVRERIRDCFESGTWEKSEDAAARLKEDGMAIFVLVLVF